VKLWDALKKKWRQWTRQEYPGPALTEAQIIEKMAADLAQRLVQHGKPFVRQTVVEASNAGVAPEHWQYVFWLIATSPEHWPALSDDMKKALRFGRDVMRAARVTPNYRSGLELPPGEAEVAVDRAVKGIAFWTASAMTSSILGFYSKALKKWERPMQSATAGRLPKDKALVYMKVLFEAELERDPSRFEHGGLLDQWVFGVLR
jgi:hypothetical protein